MVIAYHEIKQSEQHSALRHGLKCTARGDKGSDKSIAKTDKLLDECRPPELRAAGVGRDNNLYCYLQDGGKIVDIRDGTHKDWWNIIESPNHRLIEVEVDPDRSFVSDLDLYDDIKETLRHGHLREAKMLAAVYWSRLLPLSEYSHRRGFRRPELMVTYDVPPTCLQPI